MPSTPCAISWVTTFYFKQPAGRWTQSRRKPKAKLDRVVHDAYPAALKTYKPAYPQLGVPGQVQVLNLDDYL